MDEAQGKPICAQEALDLLNCVIQSTFDQEKCHHLLQSLRECVLAKKLKKFFLAEQEQQETKHSNKKA